MKIRLLLETADQWRETELSNKPYSMKKTMIRILFASLVCASAHSQVNSGSNGSDGALDYSGITSSTNIVIDMHDHPSGIYNYTYINIPLGVTISFIPNANNSPVTWLVQSNCEIDGTVDVSGQPGNNLGVGGTGGPGGWAGGSGGNPPSSGQGPGAGGISTGGSFYTQGIGGPPGPVYGNSFLLPLLGGSGGGGYFNSTYYYTVQLGGGGGGGAIFIAASNFIILNGNINSTGGSGSSMANLYEGGGYFTAASTGSGSGGGIRLLTTSLSGTGNLSAGGGSNGYESNNGGSGRIRIDAFQNNFGGRISGGFTQGFQPIIIPSAGQGVQLSITSVAGTSVSATPNGQLAAPDAIVSGQQANPIPIVVNCANLPLNTMITVTVNPANGSSVSAVGYNTTGTLASSTATVSINMPRGGGIIYATAATGN